VENGLAGEVKHHCDAGQPRRKWQGMTSRVATLALHMGEHQ